MDKNVKLALIIGGIVVGLLVIVPSIVGLFYGGWSGGWGMMGPGMMGGFGWGGGVMAIGMIVFWGLIIWGIVILVRAASGQSGGDSSRAESALEILKRRYARGDITKEEYEERKKDLL